MKPVICPIHKVRCYKMLEDGWTEWYSCSKENSAWPYPVYIGHLRKKRIFHGGLAF